MIFFKENIKFLRKQKKLTQTSFAEEIGIKRSLIGSYEEGRGIPKLEILQKMANYFGINMDELLSHNLSLRKEKGETSAQLTSSIPPILSVIVDSNNKEQIAIVPAKAAAGYLNGRADMEFMAELPHFSMPISELSREKSYRVFQIKGESMLPIPSGSYIFCDYVEHANDLREGQAYIIVTANDGIVYKRIFNGQNNTLLLKSDNADFSPYYIDKESVVEIWKALGYLSFDLPKPITL